VIAHGCAKWSSSWRPNTLAYDNSCSYFFFRIKHVIWLMLATRDTSATGGPFSPCLTTKAFGASVNIDP
ncbi:hypothetical protein ABTN27_21015, partial [Acinetobacter baumannii]